MPRLVRGLARTAAIAGTATVVSNRVSRRQAGRWAAKDQQAAAAYEQQAPPPAPAPKDKITELKQLAELRDQGVLTEVEFAAQKQIILSS
jgi:hypothetical protein